MKTLHPLLKLSIACCIALAGIPSAFAAAGQWQKGVNMTPTSSTDFGSSSFQQSVQNLKQTNADYVTLVVPYYQSNLYTTDIAPGWNTPTDASLASAIDYVHSQGMKVAFKVLDDSYDGQWRAYINPGDRDGWFIAYSNVLNHLADIGQQHGVEEIIIGTELTDMTRQSVNYTNAQHWNSLIGAMRSRYSGILTYSAQHNDPNEAPDIGFWGSLDYIGLSAYHPLATYTDYASVDQLKAAWDDWRKNFLDPLHNQFGKDIIFTELGFRSVQGAHKEPAAWWRGGGVDMGEQARDIESLNYFYDVPYFRGLQYWDWKTNPNAGGPNDSDYTPQNKDGQQALTNLYGGVGGGGPPPPPPPTTVSCSSTPGTNAFNSCYYSTKTFTNPVLNRTDTTLNSDWGTGSPDPAVPADNFSLVSAGTFSFDAADYTFTATADDGVRVSIDGTPIIDHMVDQPATTYTVTKTMTAGSHIVKVEYYEGYGNAVLKVSWAKGAITPPPPSVSCSSTPGTNAFSSCYYDNQDFTALKLTRSDTALNFDWADGSPDPSVAADTFSVRSQGSFTFDAADYTFTANADDGVRVSVDGTVIIDKFIDQPATTYTATKTMTAGTHTILVEYYEAYGNAVLKLSWAKVAGTPTTPTACADTVGSNAFYSCYFGSRDFTNLKLSRTDTAIDFDWGGGPPDPSVPADNFSLRSLGNFNFDAGDYTFTATTDDGMRVSIDGTPIIDKFFDQAATTYSVTKTMTAGMHTIKVEYYDSGGNAVAKVNWTKNLSATSCPDAGNGVFASCYYDNQDFTNLKLVRMDNAINFDWGGGSPDPSIGSDTFSLRSKGNFTFDAGTYTFSVTGDDGIRLLVDGTAVIDKFFDQGATTYTATRDLTAGTHLVTVEYYENGGNAVAKASWSKNP